MLFTDEEMKECAKATFHRLAYGRNGYNIFSGTLDLARAICAVTPDLGLFSRPDPSWYRDYYNSNHDFLQRFYDFWF